MQSRLIRNPLAGRASQCHSVSQKKGRKFFRGKELLDYTRSTGIFIKSRPFFLVLPGIRSQRRESGCISVPQGRTPGCTWTMGSPRSVRGSGLRLVTAWLQASRRPPAIDFGFCSSAILKSPPDPECLSRTLFWNLSRRSSLVCPPGDDIERPLSAVWNEVQSWRQKTTTAW
jgi:hypothetical protein